MSAEIFAEGIREILRLRGLAFLDDARKVEGLFRDLWPERRRETNILLAALREKIPQEISQATSLSQFALCAWCDRLADISGLTEEAARWAVWVWAAGLGAKIPPSFAAVLSPVAKPKPSVDIDALYFVEHEEAETLFKSGQWAEAAKHLEIVLRLKESASANFMLGRCYCEVKNYGEAALLFRRAIAIDGADTTPMNWLAWLMHYISHDYLEAERLYSHSLHLNADQFYPSYRLGLLLFEVRKDYVQAEKLFRISVQLRPRDANAISSLATLLYDVKKDYAQAEVLYRKAVELAPDNGPNLANLAGALVQLNRQFEALHFAQRAKSLGYADHWVYKTLGI